MVKIKDSLSSSRTLVSHDYEVGERTALMRIANDERSQQLIRQAHREWLSALDAINDLIFMHDKDFRIMRSNRAYAERAGMTVKEVLGKLYWEVFPLRAGPLPHCRRMDQQVLESESGISAEEMDEIQLESGEIFMSRSFAIRDEAGAYLYSLHIMEDITERKQLDEKLRTSESNYRLLFESSRDALTTAAPPTWNFASANPMALKLFGAATEAEFLTLAPWDLSPERQPDGMLSAAKAKEITETVIREGSLKFEWMHRRKDGSEFPAEVLLTLVRQEGRTFIQASTRDITERKKSEEKLNQLNRNLRVLSACNHELVHAADESLLLQAMCKVIVELGGYRMAWVGYLLEDEEKSIRPMAYEGLEEGYLEKARISWGSSASGQGPVGRAARTGQIQIAQDILRDPSMLPWRMEATIRGYASSIALPLADGANVFGALSIYSAQADTFDPEEVAVLGELAEDLAFGIVTLRAQAEKKRTAELLRRGVEETVKVIATMVEMRDPYTSGHQQRVADLARAIAIEMGYSGEQVNGLHLAGLIHDLGKIQIPAEILSKPGRLTATEFSLIKTHAQTGYEVLKDIKFPWPIAQMVLQHHERLDGSGYPQGLTGDQIIVDAKILMVADVVEAMASHRPYRPGFGISAALEEIRKNAGKFYDPEVVAACVRLFEQDKFPTPEVWSKH